MPPTQPNNTGVGKFMCEVSRKYYYFTCTLMSSLCSNQVGDTSHSVPWGIITPLHKSPTVEVLNPLPLPQKFARALFVEYHTVTVFLFSHCNLNHVL